MRRTKAMGVISWTSRATFPPLMRFSGEGSQEAANSWRMSTQIRASNSAGVDILVRTLGTGHTLKTRLDAELTSRGLSASTRVSQVSTSTVDAAGPENTASEDAGGPPLELIIGGAGVAAVAVSGVVLDLVVRH